MSGSMKSVEGDAVGDPEGVFITPGGDTLVLPCLRCGTDISVPMYRTPGQTTCPSCGQEVHLDVGQAVPAASTRSEFVDLLDRIAIRDGEPAVARLRARIDELYPPPAPI